jgi:hypothetical protein
MRLTLPNLLLVLATFFLAVIATQTAQPQKSVIVSYPADTPDSVLSQAKEAILQAGGFITHEYNIIKYVFPTLN